ncbi:MAG: glycosyltransferase [Actinomycetia bacterium]|nr:glycosyltransferase [Actinomycetes bacterium]
MRILLVSQMYPGASAPDLGVFVRQIELELAERGHEVARAVVDRRSGGKSRHIELARAAQRRARDFRPDVVYSHFLFPTGAIAAVAARRVGAAHVTTAHGFDVRNIGAVPGVRAATRLTVRGSDRVIAVSRFLRDELVAKVPEAEGRVEVINCGVDLRRFVHRDPDEWRRSVGWVGEGPFYLCVGTLDERKNVLRLATAFERLGAGQLAFVGDGPLRASLQGRPRIRVEGPVEHRRVADYIAAADVVCQPSLVEPFGQALLEAMASERSVVATRIGGPPEFVPPEAGLLVDPLNVQELAEGLRMAAALPSPNGAARIAASDHDLRLQAARVERTLERACG